MLWLEDLLRLIAGPTDIQRQPQLTKTSQGHNDLLPMFAELTDMPQTHAL